MALARSWFFRSRAEPGEPPLAAGESAGPCCLEADRAVVRLHRRGRGVAGRAVSRYAAGLCPRSQPGDSAGRLLPHRRAAEHAGRRSLPVHPPDRRAGLRFEPDARQRDDLGREAVPAEEGKEGPRRDPGECSTRWSNTCGTPRRGSSGTPGWPARFAHSARPPVPTSRPRPRRSGESRTAWSRPPRRPAGSRPVRSG